MDEGLYAEPDEIGGAQPFDGVEDWLRREQDGDKAKARRHHPDHLAEGHSKRRCYAGSAPAEERAANGDQGIGAGRNDHERRDDEERPHRSRHDASPQSMIVH